MAFPGLSFCPVRVFPTRSCHMMPSAIKPSPEAGSMELPDLELSAPKQQAKTSLFASKSCPTLEFTFCGCAEKFRPRQPGEERTCFHLHFQSTSDGSQGRTEVGAKTAARGTLLTGWLSPGCIQLSLITQDHLPRNDTILSGLGPLISTSNQENSHRHAHRPVC